MPETVTAGTEYAKVHGHPLQTVPQNILNAARQVMAAAVLEGDADADLAEPIADAIVGALAERNMLRPTVVDYSQVEWEQHVDQSGWGVAGFVADSASGLPIAPQELVQRHNELIVELTVLRAERKALIDCLKHADVGIKAAMIALGKV